MLTKLANHRGIGYISLIHYPSIARDVTYLGRNVLHRLNRYLDGQRSDVFLANRFHLFFFFTRRMWIERDGQSDRECQRLDDSNSGLNLPASGLKL